MSDKHVEDILSNVNEGSAFEYGCGGSTIFFSKVFHRYTSVEHSKSWYEKIKPHVPENVTLKLREPVGSVVPALGPGNVAAQKDYINTINETPDIYSFILVDGRCRVECARAAIKNMNEHSILFVHDYERPKYRMIETFLNLKQITTYEGDKRSLASFSLK
jgi:hypothetical protein